MALMCKEHDLELLLFCKTCEELVCKHCVAKGHNDHDYANARMEVCKCQMFEKFTTSAEEVVRNVSEVQDTTDKTKKVNKVFLCVCVWFNDVNLLCSSYMPIIHDCTYLFIARYQKIHKV